MMLGSARHRVAIFGAGMIANRHVDAWREAGAEVAAVIDNNPDVLRAFAEKHGIENTATDYAEFLQSADADRVDIVDICTPPWLHARMAIAAAQAGKHILGEKPVALNSAEGYAMADAADAAGVVIGCRQGATRLSEPARTLRAIVDSGVLGDIYFMRLLGRSLYRPGIEYNPSARWFLDRSLAGGGALYDWGVYDLELLLGMFGALEVTNVVARTFRGVDEPAIDTPFDVEEHAIATLTLATGATIFWERGWATHLPEEHRWDMYGTRAGLTFVPHSEVLRRDMNLRISRYAPQTPVELPVPPLADPGPSVYEDFLNAIDTGGTPASPARECAQMLAIIERIYAAAENSAPAVALGERLAT